MDYFSYHVDDRGHMRYAYEVDWDRHGHGHGHGPSHHGDTAPTALTTPSTSSTSDLKLHLKELTENDIDILLTTADANNGVLSFVGYKLTGEIPLFVTDLITHYQNTLMHLQDRLLFSYLNVSHTNLDIKGLECFISTIVKYDNIDMLPAASAQSVPTATTGVAPRAALEVFICRGNKSLTKEVCILLAQLLTKTTSLTILDFRDNALSDQGVVTLASVYSMTMKPLNTLSTISLFTLQILDLSGNDLSDMAVLALSRGLGQALKSRANASESSTAARVLNLKVLRLHRNKITDKGAHCLAQLVSPTVQSMINIHNSPAKPLSSSSMTNKGSSSASTNCLPLLELGLSENPIGSKGIHSLMTALGDSNLRVLHLGYCQPSFASLDALTRHLLATSEVEMVDLSFSEAVSRHVVTESRHKRSAMVQESLTGRPWTALMTALVRHVRHYTARVSTEHEQGLLRINLGLLPLELWQQYMQEPESSDSSMFSAVKEAEFSSSPMFTTSAYTNSQQSEGFNFKADLGESLILMCEISDVLSLPVEMTTWVSTNIAVAASLAVRESPFSAEDIQSPSRATVQSQFGSSAKLPNSSGAGLTLADLAEAAAYPSDACSNSSNNSNSNGYGSPLTVSTAKSHVSDQRTGFSTEISSPFDLLTTMKSYRKEKEHINVLAQSEEDSLDNDDPSAASVIAPFSPPLSSPLLKRDAPPSDNQSSVASSVPNNGGININRKIFASGGSDVDEAILAPLPVKPPAMAISPRKPLQGQINEIDSRSPLSSNVNSDDNANVNSNQTGDIDFQLAIQRAVLKEIHRSILPLIAQQVSPHISTDSTTNSSTRQQLEYQLQNDRLDRLESALSQVQATVEVVHDRVSELEAQSIASQSFMQQTVSNFNEVFSRIQRLENAAFHVSPVKTDTQDAVTSINQEVISTISQRAMNAANRASSSIQPTKTVGALDDQLMDIIGIMTTKMAEISDRLSSLETSLEAEHESSVNVLQILLEQQQQQQQQQQHAQAVASKAMITSNRSANTVANAAGRSTIASVTTSAATNGSNGNGNAKPISSVVTGSPNRGSIGSTGHRSISSTSTASSNHTNKGSALGRK